MVIRVLDTLIILAYTSLYMETLSKLFGGQNRVKIMRLFLLNPEQAFEIDEIISRSRVTRINVRREISALSAMGFIKQKTLTKSGARGAKKKIPTWTLNHLFRYLNIIRDVLVDPNLLVEEDIVERFKPIGKIKLLIVSGVFIGGKESRVDIMIVGDKLKKNVIQQIVKVLEAEIGKELNYVVFDGAEFKYRLDMYDKLVCDIIDYPHKRLVDTGQLSTYISKK